MEYNLPCDQHVVRVFSSPSRMGSHNGQNILILVFNMLSNSPYYNTCTHTCMEGKFGGPMSWKEVKFETA